MTCENSFFSLELISEYPLIETLRRLNVLASERSVSKENVASMYN